MSFDNSLFNTDAGYYEYIPGKMWLPGKLVGRMTWSRRAVDDAVNVELKDSDVILATYPKTGNVSYKCNSEFHDPSSLRVPGQ